LPRTCSFSCGKEKKARRGRDPRAPPGNKQAQTHLFHIKAEELRPHGENLLHGRGGGGSSLLFDNLNLLLVRLSFIALERLFLFVLSFLLAFLHRRYPLQHFVNVHIALGWL
jgi:hypothetical protein